MYMATQANGILVTAGQIYVSSLDAAPREQDVFQVSRVSKLVRSQPTRSQYRISICQVH